MPDKYDHDERLRLAHHHADAEQAEATAEEVLGQLADAITLLASKRRAIPVSRLLRESALNLLIIGRTVSNLLSDPTDRERLERLTDQLVTELRHLARQRPAPDGASEPHSSA